MIDVDWLHKKHIGSMGWNASISTFKNDFLLLNYGKAAI